MVPTNPGLSYRTNKHNCVQTHPLVFCNALGSAVFPHPQPLLQGEGEVCGISVQGWHHIVFTSGAVWGLGEGQSEKPLGLATF